MSDTSHEISLGGLSVCIGMPSTRDIPPLTVKSMFKTQELCITHGIQCSLAMLSGNAIIQWARDEVVHLCLQSPANRFFFIDSDIVWNPEDFMRMIALSQRYDILCASYPAKKDPTTFYIRYDQEKELIADDYGIFEIQGVGLGFTVINRGVIEHIHKVSPKVRDEISETQYAEIFRVGSFEGNRRGEDMSFFESLSDLGYKIHLDPSIELGHIGTKVWYGKALDAMVQS